jgi:hypothetical protein
MLKVINNAFQTNLATRQSKKRCWMFSSKPHRLHLESPFHLLFNKLSFVRITPLFKYQRKILIFRGNFAFQNSPFLEVFSLFIISLYNDCVEKTLFFICQMKLSLSLFRLTCSTKDTNLSHSFSLSPTIPYLKETFSGVELSTLATEAPFFLTILHRSGNFRISGY